MSLHTSLVVLLPSIVVNALVPIILWICIYFTAKPLKISQAEKNRINLFAALALFGWFLLSLSLALLDFYHVSENLLSPLVPVAFLLPIVFYLQYVSPSTTFQKLLDAFPQHWLISIQVFRLLGVIFILLYMQGQLPALFAIPSGVGDMVIGLSAPIVAYWFWKKKSGYRELTKSWNYVGILDLIIAIITGVFLAVQEPLKVALTATSTEIMTIYPLVLIPAYAVPLGFILHLASLRLLQREKQK